MFVELGLETLKERESIGSAASKAGKDITLVNPPDLACARLNDDVAERNLPVTAHGNPLASSHRQDCGAVVLLHVKTLVFCKNDGGDCPQSDNAK